MIPILYDRNETAFASNGLGRLRDCITCEVTEERNGIFECDFEYPINGAHYEDIQLGRIIGVEHDDTSDVQPFDIVSYSRPINGVVTFHCTHISYRQSKIVASGTNVSGLTNALAMLKNGQPSNPFTYWTDKESIASFPLADGIPRSVRSMLGGIEGSILDTYGGEYEWDKFTVKLWERRGEDTPFSIRYGVNMTSFTDETDSSETYSAIMPYWIGQDGDTQTVIKGGVVSNGGQTVTGRVEVAAVDLSQEFETAPAVSALESLALNMLNSKKPNLAAQSISVSFIRLQDTGEYDNLEQLLDCKLCDTVNVVFPNYGTSGRFKIVKTVYNVLSERFTSMELGTLSTTLAEALGINNSTTTVSNSSGGDEGEDVIVETGTSGNWTYRKWKSGTAECWYSSANKTVGVNSAYGHGYYGVLQAINYPSGLFNAAPSPFITLVGGDGLWAGISAQSAAQISYYPYAVASGNHTYAERIFAVGKWK